MDAPLVHRPHPARGRLGLALAAGLVLWTGCSSAPKVPEGIYDRKNQAAAFLDHGRTAFREGKLDDALGYNQFALDLDTAVDDEAGMAAAWNSVATVQMAMGKDAEARLSLVEAESFAVKAGNKTLKLQVAINQAQADLRAGDSAAARARLTALQPFPPTAEGAALDHVLGLVEKADDHPEEALAAFNRSLAVNLKLKLRSEAAADHFMRGSVFSRQSRWAEAETELRAALALDKTMEDTQGIGQDWRALGTVLVKAGRPEEAREAFLRSVRVYRAASLVDQAKKSVEALLPVLGSLGLKDEQARWQAYLAKPYDTK